MALPWNAGSAQPAGEVFPVADAVSVMRNSLTYAPVSVSDNGVLLYWSGSVVGSSTRSAGTIATENLSARWLLLAGSGILQSLGMRSRSCSSGAPPPGCCPIYGYGI
jgi:hypothetical protein